jgi:hypothetical protein
MQIGGRLMASGENFTGILNQSTSLFDVPSTNTATLLQLQTIASQPFIGELSSASGVVLPDVAPYDRLSSFPEDLYDLRPASHLVRFLKALLGDGGVGQLRKRYALTQFANSLTSTHFYDLDKFYGALFGARRSVLAQLPLDPTTEVATPDGWDDVHALDAIFRERIIKLAKAITLGATPMGMQALAEALTGVECDIYEVWQQLDTAAAPAGANTYATVASSYANYGAMRIYSWGQISGVVSFGKLAINARNEFVVRPKTVYNPSDPTDAIKHAEDLYGVLRVINVLKPAQTLASVDDTGLAVHQKVSIRAVAADSEFWEVTSSVIPQPTLADTYHVIYQAYDNRAKPTQIQAASPRPPFNSSQGQEWSYVNEVTSVKGYAKKHGPDLTTSAAPAPNLYDTVRFFDGKSISYRPEYATIDPRQAMAAQAAGDGSLASHAYSGPRKVVPTHG